MVSETESRFVYGCAERHDNVFVVFVLRSFVVAGRGGDVEVMVGWCDGGGGGGVMVMVVVHMAMFVVVVAVVLLVIKII